MRHRSRLPLTKRVPGGVAGLVAASGGDLVEGDPPEPVDHDRGPKGTPSDKRQRDRRAHRKRRKDAKRSPF